MFRILIALAVATSTASAQLVEPAPPKPIVPVDTFSAEGADVDTLAKILGDQFSGIKFSADRVSSTIFARVDGEDADRVKRLIEEVRIRAVDANHRRQKIEEQALKDDKALRRAETETELQSDPLSQLQSYQLKHISADEAARVLSLLAYDEQAVVAVAGSNLLVRASAGALDQISEVLKEMDRPSPPSAQPEQLFQRAVEMASDIEPALPAQRLRQFAEPDMNAAQREMKLLQLQALELAQEIQVNEHTGHHRELMEALHENVSQQFRQKLAQDRREMGQIRHRLDQISERLEMQERLADRIIDQRIQELIQGRIEQLADQTREEGDQLVEDQARLMNELNKDRKQWQEQPLLNKLETELERLQTIERQQGSQLQGELAETQALLQAAYRDLKRRLYPDDLEENEIVDKPVLEAEDEVEEVIEEEISVSVPDETKQP